jgi:hypothetical protein
MIKADDRCSSWESMSSQADPDGSTSAAQQLCDEATSQSCRRRKAREWRPMARRTRASGTSQTSRKNSGLVLEKFATNLAIAWH